MSSVTKKPETKNQENYEVKRISNCGNNAKIILVIGALAWVLFTYVITLWLINYANSLKKNNYDAVQATQVNPNALLGTGIAYIVFSVAVVIIVLVLIFKSYNIDGAKCKSGGIFKITFIIFGVIMIYASIYVLLGLLWFIPALRDAENAEPGSAVLVDEPKVAFINISGIFILILSALYFIYALVIIFTKNNAVVTKCAVGDTKCEESLKKLEEKQAAGGASTGIFSSLSRKLNEYKTSSLQEQYKNKDFDRIKMAEITSPIDVTNVDKIYPDKLKPTGVQNAKGFADKSLEICANNFAPSSPRYEIAQGNPSRDPCKYWGLKPGDKVEQKPITGTTDKIFTVVSSE